jgi:hypothetical protein
MQEEQTVAAAQEAMAFPTDMMSSSVFRLQQENFHDEDWMDNCRILIIELIHHLSLCLKDKDYWSTEEPEKDCFKDLIKSIRKLNRMLPKNKGRFLIRLTGDVAGNEALIGENYEIRFDDIIVDYLSAEAIVGRLGGQMAFLSALLKNAFDVFRAYQINCLYLELPDESPRSINALRISLNILSFFPEAAKVNSPIKFFIGKKPITLPLILNEKEMPDYNLTLTAGLNLVPAGVLQEAVNSVYKWMRQSSSRNAEDQYASVYNALLEVDNLKGKLTKPPIEVNNIKWLMIQNSDDIISKQKALLAQSVSQMTNGSFSSMARYMASIYGDRYNRISLRQLCENVGLISDLVNLLRQQSEMKIVLSEIFQNVGIRLEQVPAEIFDELVIEDNRVRVEAEGETVERTADKTLLKMINSYRQRFSTRNKLSHIFSDETLELGNADYEILATDYGLPSEAVDVAINCIRKCFDNQGRFNKGAFEECIDILSEYRESIFPFLWINFKDAAERNGRTAFINALYMFIDRIGMKLEAAIILLKDVLWQPESISFSDRNAIMLAGMFLRKFNKELDIEIEITPEEVLMVKEGLDKEVVDAVTVAIDEEFENFLCKIRTVHNALQEALNPANADKEHMPVRYLLALERELHIFLALIGGSVETKVLRSAVRKYGNPEAKIYLYAVENEQHMNTLLQHLKVLVRALGRSMRKRDISLVNDIISRKNAFIRLGNTPQHDAAVDQVIRWVDTVRNEIISKYEARAMTA